MVVVVLARVVRELSQFCIFGMSRGFLSGDCWMYSEMKDRHKGLKVSERVTGALSLEMRFEARAWLRKRQVWMSIDLALEPQVSQRFPRLGM